MITPTKSDIDRRKQRAGSRKILVSKVRAILVQYHQGRAASSCMDEIDKAMRAVK
jgi:hypothetical protein